MRVEFAPLQNETIRLSEINMEVLPNVGEIVVIEGLACEAYEDGQWSYGCIDSSSPDFKVVGREWLLDSDCVLLFLAPYTDKPVRVIKGKPVGIK